MSLILEALRKSEAERRRGQAPDLFAPVTQPAPLPAAAPARGPWRVAAVGTSLLLAVVAWRLLAPAGGAVPADRSGEAAAGVEAAVPAAQAVDSGIASDDTSDVIPAATTPPQTVDATPDTTPAPAAVVTTAAPTVATPSAAVSTTVDAAAPATASAPLPAPPTPAAPPAPRPQAAGVAMPGPSIAPPSRPAQAASALPGPAPAGTRPQADDGTVRLSELPSGERAQLPPLKMSMHMWAPDPAQRFVILDGNRVGQGDRVGDAVVEEITGDSAVLAWHGRRIKVPLR